MSVEPTHFPNAATRVLVVEADSGLRSEVCRLIADRLGWETIEAADADSAYAVASESHPQIILSGLGQTPESALEFLEELQNQAPDAPVVILMSAGQESQTLRALQKGVAGYAAVDNIALELPEILERVAASAQSHRDRKRLQSCLTKVELRFAVENDPALVPTLVAELQDYLAWLGFLDRSAQVRLIVALEEAILNAMIHGNLEIDSALRQSDEAKYRAEIVERRGRRPFRHRKVQVSAQLRTDRVLFSITDGGPGFDPGALPDPTDPANLEQVGGRGLLLIRTFMDEVRFNRKGNRITMVKYRSPKLPPAEGRQ